MNKDQIQKAINEIKELRDIRDEYQKTYKLLQEQRWDELRNHITTVMMKHPTETMIHNFVNPHKPSNIQQSAVNCMGFLENLFKAKLGVNIADVTKYLMN